MAQQLLQVVHEYHEIETSLCEPTPGNRRHSLQALEGLIASIEEIGQTVVGTVYRFEDKFRIAAGVGRWQACMHLGIKFKAHILDKEPTEAELILIRLAENTVREEMTDVDIGQNILNLMRLTRLSQIEVAKKTGISPAKVSKYITIQRLSPELREWQAAGKLDFEAAYYVARLPYERMKEAAQMIVDGGLKKDDAIALVNSMKGKKTPKQPKKNLLTIKFEMPAVNYVDAVLEFLKERINRLNSLKKHGDIPPDALGRLLS